MGCTSSTEYVVDPSTGKEKKVNKFGGAHPGNRRPQHAPYAPPAHEFGKDGKATAHFVAVGGGNALQLVSKNDNGNNSNLQNSSSRPPEHVEVILPDGVSEGQTIHVQAPGNDGRVNAVVVPAGFGPGDKFIVEFAPAGGVEQSTATTAGDDYKVSSSLAQNPNYYEPNTAAASATAVQEPEVYVPSYNNNNDNHHHDYSNHANIPSASAYPVYSAPPQYPSAQSKYL